MSTTKNYELMSAVSLGADAESAAIPTGRFDAFSVQCTTTGSPVGTIKLQASNDEGVVSDAGDRGGVTGITNWDDVSGAAVAVSGAGIATLSSAGQHYRWARIVYVRTSGTGAVTARVSAKVSE